MPFWSHKDKADKPPDPQVIANFRRQVEGVRRTVLYDGDVGLFRGWYFELRLKEEIQRCDRYNLTFALITVRLLNLQHYDLAEDAWQRQSAAAAYAIAQTIRGVDLAASFGAGEFALCLIHCDSAGAERALRRLVNALAEHPNEIGVAVYPEDKADARHLLDLARIRARPYNSDALAV
jgi:GGDEF domain-containing protein